MESLQALAQFTARAVERRWQLEEEITWISEELALGK